jgi:hypothetical protein
MAQDQLESNWSKYEFSAFKLVTPTGQTGVTLVALIYTRLIRHHIGQTGLHNQVRRVSTQKVYALEFSHGAHGVKGGEQHDKHKDEKLKLTFNELMAKYVKMRDGKIAAQSSNVKPSRSSPWHKSK